MQTEAIKQCVDEKKSISTRTFDTTPSTQDHG